MEKRKCNDSHTIKNKKKNDKQGIKNYRPVSLLPLCSTVLEHIIYKMFTYFIENNLVSENQTAFKPSDSCIDQLLTITHETLASFDDNYEVTGGLLRHFKTFW